MNGPLHDVQFRCTTAAAAAKSRTHVSIIAISTRDLSLIWRKKKNICCMLSLVARMYKKEVFCSLADVDHFKSADAEKASITNKNSPLKKQQEPAKRTRSRTQYDRSTSCGRLQHSSAVQPYPKQTVVGTMCTLNRTPAGCCECRVQIRPPRSKVRIPLRICRKGVGIDRGNKHAIQLPSSYTACCHRSPPSSFGVWLAY